MTDVLFIFIASVVAYVIYVIVTEQKTTASHEPVTQAEPEKPMVAVKKTTPRSVPKKKEVLEIKPVAAATPKPETLALPKDAGKKGLKDPKNGDVATTYSNYRFTKRWIKEALVTEGLLDKVYKNDELNAELEATIKSAVLKLEALDNYRV